MMGERWIARILQCYLFWHVIFSFLVYASDVCYVHDGITSGIIAASQTVHQIKWHKSGLCQEKNNFFHGSSGLAVVWFWRKKVVTEKDDMLSVSVAPHCHLLQH